MLGQVDVAEPSFSKFGAHLVLSEATAGIEVLAFGCIEYGFVFDVLEIILEILCAIRIE